MAELKIDIDGINNKVIPLLNKAKTELESAASSLSAISYSPDYYKFTNRSRVQSVLPQNIRNIKTDVNNINKWLSDISTKFKEADRKSNNSVNSLLGKLDKINLSNSIAKTGGAIVGVAAQSMAIGQDNITIFAQKGFELAETIVNGVQDGINFVGAKISSAWDSFYNAIVKPGINFFEECKAKVSNFVTGAVNEISKGINNIKDGITSFAQKGWDKLCGMAQSVGDAFNSVGAHISSAWNSFCTDVWPNIWDGIQSFGASVANVVTGFIKGLCQFVESLVDVVVILGTAIGSIGTGIYDGISYLVSLANGTSDEWESVTGAMWGNVMGFVAEDHVGNAFADFYKNNVVGQWLDEHAIDVCKSDGIVTNIFSGLGYVTGEVLLTIATLGVGTAVSAGATTLSFATTSAVVAGTSAFGKYTQEAWGNARDSSWEGIERSYQKGEITEEEYNTFTAIRSMTDEQWAEIEKDYKDGKISEEEFEQIKQIREMPEDWKTFENGWKGLLYGVANGVWEGVQWYVGGKLAGWTIKGGSQLASSTIRVGTDTIFNAVDTPFRAAMDTITYGKTWNQAWEEQGGWQSVLTNIGIGLVGSTGGEIFDGVKLNKASKVLDANKAFDSLDETTAKKVKDALLDDHKAGKIDLSKITDKELNDEITKKLVESGVNVIDPNYGFQLNTEDFGGFYKAKYEQGFFTKEQIDDMLDSINSKGYIDENTGKFLKNLFEDDNSRIYIKTINSNDADSIMEEGIRCLGTTTSGYGTIPKNISDISLGNTVTDVTDGGLYELITRLKGANGVSQGGNPIDGAVILKIPKDTSLEDIFKYNQELGLYNIDSKYNVGFIGCDANGVLDSTRITNINQTIKDININPQSSLVNDYKAGNINLQGMTNTDVENIIQQKISNRGWYSDTDYRYQYQYESAGSYGCDQGGISKLIKFKKPDGQLIEYNSPEYNQCLSQGIPLQKQATQEYFDIKKDIMNKYNMSNRDASSVISALDTIGACSYASQVNDLISFFSTRQDEFEKIFGFSLYKQNKLGVYEVNDKEILADLFVFNNHVNNGGSLLYTDEYGNTHVNYNNITRDINGYSAINSGDLQNYMMWGNGMQDNSINAYLKSKGSQYTYVSGKLNECQIKYNRNGIPTGKSYTNKTMQDIINNADYCMKNGYELQCYIAGTKNAQIRFIDMETNKVYVSTANWNEGGKYGAHAVKITGMTQDGFIVSSWGERLLIPYSDLQKSGAFTIFAGQYK